ncbi:MAG: hypothetical protein ACP5HM_06040 [Anaerolineae bacterium]
MDGHRDRRPTRTTSADGGRVDDTVAGEDWRVIALSAAGICFIALGLFIFALSEDQEGTVLWQLGSEHALRTMDLAATFTVSLGVALTWIGGMLWQRQIKS